MEPTRKINRRNRFERLERGRRADKGRFRRKAKPSRRQQLHQRLPKDTAKAVLDGLSNADFVKLLKGDVLQPRTRKKLKRRVPGTGVVTITRLSDRSGIIDRENMTIKESMMTYPGKYIESSEFGVSIKTRRGTITHWFRVPTGQRTSEFTGTIVDE